MKKIIDGYTIISKPGYLLFKTVNKKGKAKQYKVTETSCECMSFKFRNTPVPGKCKHMILREENNITIEKGDPKKELRQIRKIKSEVTSQWRQAFKKHNITDTKEQKWMIKNCNQLVRQYHVYDCKDAHLIYTNGGINV